MDYEKHDHADVPADIEARLRRHYQVLLKNIARAQQVTPACPPRPRVMMDLLDPAERSHVHGCAHCQAAARKCQDDTIIRRIRARASEMAAFFPPPVWVPAVVGVIALVVVCVIIWGRTGVVPHLPEIVQQHPDDPTLIARMGEGNMARMFQVRAKSDRLLSPSVITRLDAQRLSLAPYVSPATFLELEELTGHEAASVPADLLVQFEDLKLEEAKLVKPELLLQIERAKATLLQNLSPGQVLEINRLDFEAGRVSGQQTLEFLITAQAGVAGKVNSGSLLRLARKHTDYAISRMRPDLLRTLAGEDYNAAAEAKGTQADSGAVPRAGSAVQN